MISRFVLRPIVYFELFWNKFSNNFAIKSTSRVCKGGLMLMVFYCEKPIVDYMEVFMSIFRILKYICCSGQCGEYGMIFG